MKLFIFLLIMSVNIHADIKTDFGNCVNIAGDLKRLECYDLAAKSNGMIIKTEINKEAGNGKWHVEVETNPIDDTKTVFMRLASDNAGKALLIRCMSNNTEFIINWNDYLGSEAFVTSRIGKNKASTFKWSLATTKQATFYPGSPIKHIKSLFNETKYLAQVTPYNESPVTLIFDITGIENAIKPLRETCNW